MELEKVVSKEFVRPAVLFGMLLIIGYGFYMDRISGGFIEGTFGTIIGFYFRDKKANSNPTVINKTN